MIQSAFDLGEHLKLREVTFKVSPVLWEKWDITDFDLNFNNWKKIKFLNDNLDSFHPDIELVPNDLYTLKFRTKIFPNNFRRYERL